MKDIPSSQWLRIYFSGWPHLKRETERMKFHTHRSLTPEQTGANNRMCSKWSHSAGWQHSHPTRPYFSASRASAKEFSHGKICITHQKEPPPNDFKKQTTNLGLGLVTRPVFRRQAQLLPAVRGDVPCTSVVFVCPAYSSSCSGKRTSTSIWELTSHPHMWYWQDQYLISQGMGTRPQLGLSYFPLGTVTARWSDTVKGKD